MNRIGFINNTDKEIKFNFEYNEIKDTNLNINNINKSDITDNYDFILILEKDENE